MRRGKKRWQSRIHMLKTAHRRSYCPAKSVRSSVVPSAHWPATTKAIASATVGVCAQCSDQCAVAGAFFSQKPKWSVSSWPGHARYEEGATAARIMGTLVDLTSMQFGFLRVDSRAESTDRRQARWNCTCLRCGRTKVVLGYSLTTGATRTCGECKDESPRPRVTFQVIDGRRGLSETHFG